MNLGSEAQPGRAVEAAQRSQMARVHGPSQTTRYVRIKKAGFRCGITFSQPQAHATAGNYALFTEKGEKPMRKFHSAKAIAALGLNP
jgi:hypothetical protein